MNGDNRGKNALKTWILWIKTRHCGKRNESCKNMLAIYKDLGYI
jgi:hypothetical protein